MYLVLKCIWLIAGLGAPLPLMPPPYRAVEKFVIKEDGVRKTDRINHLPSSSRSDRDSLMKTLDGFRELYINSKQREEVHASVLW